MRTGQRHTGPPLFGMATSLAHAVIQFCQTHACTKPMYQTTLPQPLVHHLRGDLGTRTQTALNKAPWE